MGLSCPARFVGWSSRFAGAAGAGSVTVLSVVLLTLVHVAAEKHNAGTPRRRKGESARHAETAVTD
jgi:hypothetical protein